MIQSGQNTENEGGSPYYTEIASKPHVTQQDFNNVQNIKAKIKAYEYKISELLGVIQRQKKQNEHLKQELKQLNNNLNQVLEKVNIHKKQKQQNVQKKDQVTKKELDNSMKQISGYQKEIAALKLKLETVTPGKVISLQNQLRQKDRKIQQLINKIKILQKVSKVYQISDTSKKQEQLNTKINSLSEQLSFLNKKFTQQKKYLDQTQKAYKRQQQYAVSLEIKIKQITGSSPVKQKSIQTPRRDNKDEITKLKQNITSLQYNNSVLQKKLKIQVQSWKLKYKKLEEEMEEVKLKFNYKEKQSSIAVSKLNELKRRSISSFHLTPLQKPTKTDDNDQFPNHYERRKEYKGLTNLSSNFKKFDDSSQFNLQQNYRIAKLIFYWNDDLLYSLETQYQLINGSKKLIKTFTAVPNSQLTTFNKSEFQLSSYQYINYVQGYCNKYIQYLKMHTSKGNSFSVGTDKNQAKSKKIIFDIRTNQKPIAILGIIQNKKISNGAFSNVLVSFGFQIKKKQVTKKNISQKLNQKSILNDYISSSNKQKIEKMEQGITANGQSLLQPHENDKIFNE